MPLTLSLAQVHVQLGQPRANYAVAEESIREAAGRNSVLILFPELWSTGYDLPHGAQHSQANAEILQRFSRLARQHHIWID